MGVWALRPWDRRGGSVDVAVGFSAGFGIWGSAMAIHVKEVGICEK